MNELQVPDHKRCSIAASILLSAIVLAAGPVLAQQTLSLTDTENPGAGPCGIAVATTRGGTYVLVGSHFDDKLTSFKLNPQSGDMQEVDTKELPPGSKPVALGFYRDRIMVATGGTSKIHTIKVRGNGTFGRESRTVSSGGEGPTNMWVNQHQGTLAVTNGGSSDMNIFALNRLRNLSLLSRPRLLDKVETGDSPVAVTTIGNRFVVVNSGSNNAQVFNLDLWNKLSLKSTTPLNGTPSSVTAVGRNVYVGTSPAVGQSQISTFRLNRFGVLSSIGSMPPAGAGLFLTWLDADRSNVYAATISASNPPMNEIRVYDRKDFSVKTSATTNTPPSFKSLLAARARGSLFGFVNEFDNATTNVFKLGFTPK